MSVGFERKVPENLITREDLRQIFIEAVMDAFHPDHFNLLAMKTEHAYQVIAAEKICSGMLQKNADKKIHINALDATNLKPSFVQSLVAHWGSIRGLHENNALHYKHEVQGMREIATSVATRALENLSI